MLSGKDAVFPEIPVYVVSVRYFHDRHAHIDRLATRFGFEYEYIFDYDADQITLEDWSRVDQGMSAKSASNALKHFEVQKRLNHSKHSVALVLEDDVILFDGFVKHLNKVLHLSNQLDPGWLIFLGGADNKIDRRFVYCIEPKLIENPISTAEAYLIDRAGCIERLTWLRSNIIDRQADHQLKLIDESLGLKQFWFYRPIATQGSITGEFKTALDSSRSKRSRIFLRLKYEWNRFRRQMLPRAIARILKC